MEFANRMLSFYQISDPPPVIASPFLSAPVRVRIDFRTKVVSSVTGCTLDTSHTDAARVHIVQITYTSGTRCPSRRLYLFSLSISDFYDLTPALRSTYMSSHRSTRVRPVFLLLLLLLSYLVRFNSVQDQQNTRTTAICSLYIGYLSRTSVYGSLVLLKDYAQRCVWFLFRNLKLYF